MMDTQPQDDAVVETVTDATFPLSVGKTLNEARVQQGLSVADVAGRIKFAPRQVEALEADDFERLPELAFVRGFVRSYARLLHLDEAVLLNALPQSMPPQQAGTQKNSAEVPFPTAQSARRMNVVWLSSALGLAVILGIGILFFHDKPANKKIATKPVEALPVIQENAVSAVELAGPVAAAVSSVPAVAPLNKGELKEKPVQQNVAKEKNAQQAIPKEKKVAQNAKNKAPIHLVFSTDSWVDIKDKFGKTVFKQVNEPNSEQWVDGESPFSLVIGNASGVRLYYEGEEVDLKSFTNVEVARLILE